MAHARPNVRIFVAAAALAVLTIATGCSHVSTVRLQDETTYVGPGLRPIAGIQANATSAYVLFVPIPGDVDLDRVVNRMLIVRAKMMGADKVANIEFEVTPEGGVWTLRKLVGWRSARATGIAVQLLDGAPGDRAATSTGPSSAVPTTPATTEIEPTPSN